MTAARSSAAAQAARIAIQKKNAGRGRPAYFVLTGTNVTPRVSKASFSFLPCLGLVA